MSGGDLCDYAQYRINDIVEAIKEEIAKNKRKPEDEYDTFRYSEKTINEFKKAINILKKAAVKDIKQIQDYNRRKIIMATTNFKDYADVPAIDIYTLRLDRVLLALRRENKIIKIETGLDPKVIYIESIRWDLTKPTLEDQDLETQVAIYKLLGGE